MEYRKMSVQDGKLVVTSKQIDQSKLTADCFLIQFDGLSACENCSALNTDECGGKTIREQLLGAE